jgi:hypothetical protein
MDAVSPGGPAEPPSLSLTVLERVTELDSLAVDSRVTVARRRATVQLGIQSRWCQCYGLATVAEQRSSSSNGQPAVALGH